MKIIEHVNKSSVNVNLQIIILTLAIYIINIKLTGKINIQWVHFLCSSYLNDFVGGIFYIAILNTIFYYFMNKKAITSLIYIEIVLLICGIVWEYITPFFRKSTVTDIVDILVYMFSGVIYWLCISKAIRKKEHIFCKPR